jgi:hypothetical protein
MASSDRRFGLALTLAREKPSLAPGEVLRCTVVLQNQSGSPLWVNRRLAVNHPVSPPHLREVDFLIQDDQGRVAEFIAKVRIGLPQPEDFEELAPGKSIERSFDLTLYYALESGVEYEVQAVYENYFIPENLRDAPVWTGRLSSRARGTPRATAVPVPA